MLGIFKKKIDPLKELRKLLYIRISPLVGMIYGYEEKSYEIVALIVDHPSILNRLSYNEISKVKMAFEKELRSFKIGIKVYNDRKELIQEIKDMVNNRGFLNKEAE